MIPKEILLFKSWLLLLLLLVVLLLLASTSTSFDIRPSTPTSSRRNVLSTISTTLTSSILTTTATTAATTLSLPQPSNAATPLTAQEADSYKSQLERKIRKPPPKILRQNLNLDFAVLLMRSSYNAVDELDFVPMDQFQKDFFLIRQAEYLPYVNLLGGPGLVRQGDLVDPYYFDFISFAQYATIYRDISIDPAVVFEEQQPVLVVKEGGGDGDGDDEDRQEFVKRVIKRDTSILDNTSLPFKHDEIVGMKILDKLNEKFSGTASAIPSIEVQQEEGTRSNTNTSTSRPNDTVVLSALQQLVNLFIISGFAFDGKVTIKNNDKKGIGTQFEIILTAPANLWSGQALALKRANPVNDFVLKTAKVLVKRAGYKVSSSSVNYTSSQEISTLTII